jgi:hypothetical protein
LKEDFALPLEQDLAIVNAARGVHQTEGADELFRFQAGGENAKTRFRGRAHRKISLNSVAAGGPCRRWIFGEGRAAVAGVDREIARVLIAFAGKKAGRMALS